VEQWKERWSLLQRLLRTRENTSLNAVRQYTTKARAKKNGTKSPTQSMKSGVSRQYTAMIRRNDARKTTTNACITALLALFW
jgi:hypothetical protein